MIERNALIEWTRIQLDNGPVSSRIPKCDRFSTILLRLEEEDRGETIETLFGLEYMVFAPKEFSIRLPPEYRVYEPRPSFNSRKYRQSPFDSVVHPTEELHQMLAMRPIPPLCDKLHVKEQVAMHVWSCVTSPTMGNAVTRAFLTHVEAEKAEILGLRASVFYLLEDSSPIPVLEWTERDMEGMALFKFDEVSGLCSYLIHYGIGLKSSRGWQKRSLTWSLVDFQHLKILFGAAQSMKVVMGWSMEDIMNLYCKTQASRASKETLARYAQLLYDHFQYQKENGMLFDTVASLVEGMSVKKIVRGKDSKFYPMLEASWT